MILSSKFENIDNRIEQIFSKPIIPLILIFFSGFFLRLYFTPFDLPSRSQDALIFIEFALSLHNSFENIGKSTVSLYEGLIDNVSFIG